jgi:hypothetical protein
MATLRTRLDLLERALPDGRSVYELSDAELLVSVVLPPNATIDEIDDYVRKLLVSRGAASVVIDSGRRGGELPIERLLAAGCSPSPRP